MIRELSFIVLALLPNAIIGFDGNGLSDDYKAQFERHKVVTPERRIFDFRRNGIKVDMRVITAPRNESTDVDDGFPDFPVRDLGRCIIGFSLVCAKKRFGRFLDSIKQLNEIFLYGRDIKLVKTRVNADRRFVNESNDNIERSVNDFFDTFALRITLPRWNDKRERNQIDVMMDETALSEGRGKKGGGGGGGGGKGGGKCSMMMMAGLMVMKMKIMGIAAMKGMMMAGMSLMLSTAMLMFKLMKGAGGGGGGGGDPWPGGGGGGGGGPWQSGGGGGPWQSGGGGGGGPWQSEGGGGGGPWQSEGGGWLW